MKKLRLALLCIRVGLKYGWHQGSRYAKMRWDHETLMMKLMEAADNEPKAQGARQYGMPGDGNPH